MNMSRARPIPRPLLLIVVLAWLLGLPAFASAASCASTHWVGAWAASPSDASAGTSAADLFDPSANFKMPVDDETIRAVLTPTYGGSTVRVHLSNRFGTTAVRFSRTTIARKGAGAAISGSAVLMRFGGSSSITVAPGRDVESDPVSFKLSAMQTLAVSMYVSNSVAKPSEHFTARQTSYLTTPGSGDHAADSTGSAFTHKTTSRPYVDGLDVLAPASSGAVVTFGDSITDGYQGQAPTGVPEVAGTVDVNGRWPDDFARRLIADHVPLSVLNAGISGNRVLLDGAVGGNYDTFGPAALTRLNADVLGQTGVTTVIWLEGINDLGQNPNATAAQLKAGWIRGIARMHAVHLRVLMGTLTPSGGAAGAYGTGPTNKIRQQLNAWIRSQSPANGYVDFDAAVRDPSDPSRINPAYDGGDHLHFDLAGYQTMANAVKLSLLRRVPCTLPRLRLRLRVTVSPRTDIAGRSATLHFQVSAGIGGRLQSIPGAVIVIRGHHLRTNRGGAATLRLRFTHAGHVHIGVARSGFLPGGTTLKIIRDPNQRR